MLKASFYIPVLVDENRPLKLLIEAGSQTVSFLWYHCDPQSLAGLAVYNLGQPLTAGIWQKLVGAEPELSRLADQVIVCYDTRESTLVPSSYFQADAVQDILHTLFGHDLSAEARQTYIETLPAYLLYRLPKGLHEAILHTFPQALFSHTTREQVMNYAEKPADLFAIFYHQTLKLFLFHKGALQYVHYANYQTASDACYQLLNTCHRHGLAPEDIRVRLSGMIERSSPLYNELYSCFPEIGFMEVADKWTLPESMQEFPGHYFSHLTELAACVS